MKIVVLLKSVPDTASILKVGKDNKSIVTDNVNYIMNPYDEYALEEAVKLKETFSGELVVVSMGDENSKKTIRTALAVGADSAIFIKRPVEYDLTSKGVAKILAAAMKIISPDIIFAGKQAIDGDSSQVPERVAEILQISHVSCVTRLVLESSKVEVDREIEGGYYTMELALPALFTVEKGINTPRYPTLPNIMKAKRKEIKEMTPAELGISDDDIAPGIIVASLTQPRQKRLQVVLEGEIESQVKQLTSILHEEVMGL